MASKTNFLSKIVHHSILQAACAIDEVKFPFTIVIHSKFHTAQIVLQNSINCYLILNFTFILSNCCFILEDYVTLRIRMAASFETQYLLTKSKKRLTTKLSHVEYF